MEQLRQQILKLLSSTQLPPEAVYYIFKDVYRDLTDSYNEYQRQIKIAETAAAEKAAAADNKEEEKDGE